MRWSIIRIKIGKKHPTWFQNTVNLFQKFHRIRQMMQYRARRNQIHRFGTTRNMICVSKKSLMALLLCQGCHGFANIKTQGQWEFFCDGHHLSGSASSVYPHLTIGIILTILYTFPDQRLSRFGKQMMDSRIFIIALCIFIMKQQVGF